MADQARDPRVRDDATSSTGSVGDSSAPRGSTRSSRGRSRRAWRAATIAAVSGIAEHELAHRQAPRALQHLGLHLEAVAEQDHDQRDDRQLARRTRAAGRSRARSKPPCPSTKPATTNSAVSDRKLRCAIPERSAPPTRARPARHRRLEGVHGDRVSEQRARVRVTVLGKSPSWQDAGGACSGYLIEEGDTAVLLDCGNGVFSKLRRYRDYVDVDAVVLSHLHADHFLDLVPFSYALTYAPRQQPVPVDRWPGTDSAGTPAAVRADRRRARRSAACRRRLGQRRPDRERLRPAASTTRPTPSRSARCASASPRCRTSCTRARSR